MDVYQESIKINQKKKRAFRVLKENLESCLRFWGKKLRPTQNKKIQSPIFEPHPFLAGDV
ncbi:MAG: hypothetical protein H0A76_04455 [Candidatus Thiodubiliella endoseptemdiera]|uniref:Uncharacterized protein n=1 Tax=Candidatus Thiodubiliella endoseptemdiera TaxID=2738886 RepID=A0A853F2M6_9GAMM|nr:hypothetical protein [Candidatus Thiodubiliella endoseptemdiera]